jgi:hypothetical protein
MAYILERFGTLTIPDYEPAQDVGTGAAKPTVLALPGGGLYDAFGTEQVPRQGYSVGCDGFYWEASDTALKTTSYSWRAMIGKRDKLYRRVDGTADVEWAYARLVNISSRRTPQHDEWLPYGFEFLVLSPNWSGYRHGDGWLLDAGEYFDTGLVFDEATGDVFTITSPQTCVVNNAGNARVTNAILTIHAGSANITVASVVVTGISSFTWTGVLAAGKNLVIDCGKAMIHNDGADAYSGMALNATHYIDDWLRLEPGNNSVIVSLTGGAADSTIAFEFYDGWA